MDYRAKHSGMSKGLIAGIDPASKRLALVARAGRSVVMRKYDLGNASGPPACYEAHHAMWDFCQAIGPLLVQDAPRAAFIEAPLVGRGGIHSTLVQAYVSGVVQACLVQAGFKVYLVNVGTWKAAVCGNGRADKEEVSRVLGARWPNAHAVSNGDSDLIDAAALCLYGAAVTGIAEARLDGSGGVPGDDGVVLRAARVRSRVRPAAGMR